MVDVNSSHSLLKKKPEAVDEQCSTHQDQKVVTAVEVARL